MIVQNVLKKKGQSVLFTEAGTKALDAARTMNDKKIGALIVGAPDGKVEGMFSERDVARGLAEHGENILTITVGELMTKTVITCKPEDSLQKIISIMTSKRVRHLPVIDDGKTIGLISIGDVMKYRLEESLLDEEALRDYIAGNSY